MSISTSYPRFSVGQNAYESDEDARTAQQGEKVSPDDAGVAPRRSRNAAQASKAATLPTPPDNTKRPFASRRSDEVHRTTAARLVRTNGGAPLPDQPADEASSASSTTLPGATLDEFKALDDEFDTDDRLKHKNSDGNRSIAKDLELFTELQMTGYPPDVVRLEKSQLDVRGMLVDLPLSEREFYGSALSTLIEAYKLDTDEAQRLAILEKIQELDGVVRNAYNRVINDPVDRALSIFNPPMGEGFLNAQQREEVDRLERLREDFFDAATPAERKAIFAEAAKLKQTLQWKIEIASSLEYFRNQELWGEANAEVDRILREAEGQTDPAKRYELIGRQLFQINPGQSQFKDKVVLAFTQRMHDSQALRDKLNKWHIEATASLNAHGVGGPKRYTDILKNLPPVSADYIRDLSDKYTDVLSDASHRNYSITPKARAEKLAGQIIEGVMRFMLELTPLGILGDIIPSTLPNNVRMGIEFAGMFLDLLTGAGVGKQVARGAKAIAAAARNADDLAGAGVRAGAKGLIDDAGERIVKGSTAYEALSPEAKKADEALEKRTVAEAGPPVDPVSESAHEAVGISPSGAMASYADENVVPGNLRKGTQPGILEDSQGNRYIELGGKAYHVRFDADNGTWRVFFKGSPWKPQYAVRLNETTNVWEVHSDVGLLGGAPRLTDAQKQEIIRLLNEGEISTVQIAARVGVAPQTVRRLARANNVPPEVARTTPAIRDEAIRLLREGELSHREIATRLGSTRWAVDTIARNNNIDAVFASTHRRITPEIRQKVRKLIAEGKLSNAEIATQVGISRNAVSQISVDMKLPPATFLGRRRITSAIRADVIRQLREGLSQSEVSRSIGISRSTVVKIARDEGIVTRPRATPEQIDQVFTLRDQGKSVREVGTTVGLPDRRVRDIYANVNSETYKRSWWDTTPAKRQAVIHQLDQGKSAKDIAREQDLPLETVRGIANQQRVSRDSLARELLIQGKSPEEVGRALDIPPAYVERLRQGVPEGTHDIHTFSLNSEAGAVAEDMFRKGYTREDVAEKMGISLWQAHSLANQYRQKTMDSVMPKQLADLVSALNDQDHTFTTSELARASQLPEETVLLVEHEYEMGNIISNPDAPQPGTSHGPDRFGNSYEWVRPLTLDQEVQAMRAADDGKRPVEVAKELGVDRAAVESLYQEDVPLVAPADDPVAPPPPLVETSASASASAPAAVALSDADKVEIQKLAADDQLSPEFIARLLEIPLDEVMKVLA